MFSFFNMNKCHFIGFHILFLTNIAYSYVLFTANIEDVKKLARKFVSESLAEKIADFIARVSQQMIINVSEENKIYADSFDQTSDQEDKFTRNIGRQRNEETTDRKVYIKSTTNNGDYNNHAQEMVISKRPHKKYVVKETSIRQSKLRPTAATEDEYEHQDRNENTKPRIPPKKSTPRRKNVKQLELVSKMVKPKSSSISKSRPHLGKRFDTQELYANKVTYDTKHKVNDHNEEFHEAANRPQLTSTMGYAEKFLNEIHSLATNPTNLVRSLKKNQQKLGSMNYYEIPKNRVPVNDMQKFTIEEHNLKRASMDLTTKKERSEFDQYDNKMYPVAGFVATSGPVSLPRLPTEKPWWERAMPDNNNNYDKS